MKTSLRLLCGVLLTAFALSGCAEQILDSASKDPAPSVTSGEENLSVTLAEFSTDFGRVPQPSDLVLATLNDGLEAAGLDRLTGVNKNIPIRIPFSGPLANLYHDNGTWNSINGLNLANNLIILPLNGTPVTPWPTHDKAGNNILGGVFKAVYQDSNHELVLVPDNTTLLDNTTYVVAVKKVLGDTNGNSIEADALGLILMSPNPIVENGKIVNTLVREKYKNESDGGLATAMSLDGTRATYNGVIVPILIQNNVVTSHEDLAILYTFKTEEPASTQDLIDANNASLAIAGNLTNGTTAFLSDIVWENETSFGAYAQGTDTTPSTDNSSSEGANLKNALQSTFAAAGQSVPMDNISAVYKGYAPCLNFLSDSGVDSLTGASKWQLDFENKAASPGEDCPNSRSGMVGKIGFWLVKPAVATSQVVIFQHGITSNKDTLFSVANSLAQIGMATVAIDIWGHGERAYEDADASGSLENKFGNYADSGQLFMRPDNPLLTVGYLLQTQFDLTRLNVLMQANPEIITALGFAPSSSTIHFVGVSLGGIIGSNLAASGTYPANRYVLNVAGGDLSDMILNGYFGDQIRATVAKSEGYDTSKTSGQFALNSTLLGLDLLVTHTVNAGGVDPLITGSRSLPVSNVLLQEMKGDPVIPNNNTELLAQVMGLTHFKDGDAETNATVSPRTRWTFDPVNYQDGDTAIEVGHGFLLDTNSTATQQGQLQTICFLSVGKIPNPAAQIDPTTCTNN